MKIKFPYRQLLFFTLTIIFVLGCSTDDNPSPEPIEPTPPTNQQELVLEDNVKIIDSIQTPLIGTEEEIANGIYSFEGAGELEIEVGQIIVGDQGYGFLRRVTKVQSEGQVTVLTTEPAALEDLFESGVLQFNLSDENLIKSPGLKTQEGYSLENSTLYADGIVEIQLLGGNMEYNFDWHYDIGFTDGEEYFEMRTIDSHFNTDFLFQVKTEAKFTFTPQEKTLKTWNYHFWVRVPVVVFGIPGYLPVKVVMTNDLVFTYGGEIKGGFRRKLGISTNNSLDLAVEYRNNLWDDNFVMNNTNTLDISEKVGYEEAEFNMGLELRTKFLILNLVGPYVNNRLNGDLNLAVSSTTDWDFEAAAYLKSTIGITGKTFFESLKDFSPSFQSDPLTYNSPYKLERVSGDNQVGQAEEILPEPIKVKVLDSYGFPQSKVPVYFKARQDHGTSLIEKVWTDDQGFAESKWKLGNSDDEIQYLDVTVKDAQGNPISEAPIEFAATVGMKIVVNKGENESFDKNNEVVVELLVVNGKNTAIKDVKVLVSTANQHVSFSPSAPHISNENGLINFKVQLDPGNTQGVIPINLEIKNDIGEILAEKTFEVFANPLIGTWDMVTYQGGLKPGEIYYDYGYEECPTIITGWGVYHGVELIFTQDRWSFLYDEDGANYNRMADENCNIYADHPDTEFGRGIDDYHGTYTFSVEDNMLTLTEDEDGSLGSTPIQFLNDSKTKFQIGEGEEAEVYVKRD